MWPFSKTTIASESSTLEWNGYCIVKSCCGTVGRTSSAYHVYAPDGAFLCVCGGTVEHAQQLCYNHHQKANR